MISNIEEKNKGPLSSAAVSFWAVWGTRVFKFFASLRLAIFLLASLMAIMAAGTFVESYHGADAAKLVIYDAPAFHLLLLFLVANLLASALDRLPWKKKHVGFVLTHLGIITIVAGSFVTQRTMIDGQMAIVEGQTEHRINLPSPLLVVFLDNHRDWLIPLKAKPFPWKGKEKIGSFKPDRNSEPVNLWMLQNFPRGKAQEKIIAADNFGQPALQVTLHNSFVNETQWLIQNDRSLGVAQVGPAKLVFTDEKLIEQLAAEIDTNYLEIVFDEKKALKIPVSETLKLPAEILLEGTPYKITVNRVLKNAVVDGRELMEDPQADAKESKNPAVQLTLEGNSITEAHTVFANFPEFPTVHGMKPSQAGIKILYRLPGGGSKGQSHELRFVYSPIQKTMDANPKSSVLDESPFAKASGDSQNLELIYQIQTGLDVKTGIVKLGEDVPTGWMGLSFQVNTFYPSAKIERNFLAEPNMTKDEAAVPAIQILAEQGNQSKILWVGQGQTERIDFGETPINFVYGQKLIPSGFKLTLKDFKMEKYPGTEKPASFSSSVTLKDDARGIVKDTVISMNEPLIYRGFHIYQSGYRIPEGEPEVSIFAVGKDPGIPWKYTGAIVMVVGIIIMFYTRRFSTSKNA